jgi:hypothetical protein
MLDGGAALAMNNLHLTICCASARLFWQDEKSSVYTALEESEIMDDFTGSGVGGSAVLCC